MPSLDLAAVDDLCRLVFVARRLGCTVKLAGASDELCALLDLAGVTELLLENQPDPDFDETDLR
jgi:ABC-type transporter Mla MlaB component